MGVVVVVVVALSSSMCVVISFPDNQGIPAIYAGKQSRTHR